MFAEHALRSAGVDIDFPGPSGFPPVLGPRLLLERNRPDLREDARLPVPSQLDLLLKKPRPAASRPMRRSLHHPSFHREAILP